MADRDDLQLLKDCLAGKAGAWEAFVRGFAPLLADACRRTLARCGRPSGSQEASDMLQAVFLHLWERDMRALRAYRGEGSVAAYLVAVAIRRVMDDRSLAALPADPRAGSPPEGPAETLEAREAGEMLRQEMGRLPPRSRLALSLQAEGASLREIGLSLGLSPDAVAHLLARAREALRKRLGDPEKS